MNNESRPEAAFASPISSPSTVPPTDSLNATPHRRWECDGWAYAETDDAVIRLGPCVEHQGVPKPAATVEAGVDQAIADADPAWLEAATRAVRAAARARLPFTSDDLREPPYSVPEARSGAQWGALLMAMHRRGEIEACGTATSRRRAAAGRKLTLWRGTTGRT